MSLEQFYQILGNQLQDFSYLILHISCFSLVISVAIYLVRSVSSEFAPPPQPSIRPSLWERFVDGLYIRYYAAKSKRRNQK